MCVCVCFQAVFHRSHNKLPRKLRDYSIRSIRGGSSVGSGSSSFLGKTSHEAVYRSVECCSVVELVGIDTSLDDAP